MILRNLIRQAVRDTLSRVRQLDANWEESKHDRDQGGKFAEEAGQPISGGEGGQPVSGGKPVSITPKVSLARSYVFNKSLNVQERAAIQNWVSDDGSKEIQDALRGGKADASSRIDITRLDNALSKAEPLDQDLLVFRDVNRLDNKLSKLIPDNPPDGYTLTDPGYTATTTKRSMTSGRSGAIAIMLPKGIQAGFVSSMSSTRGYSEVLLPRGSSLKYDAANKLWVASSKTQQHDLEEGATPDQLPAMRKEQREIDRKQAAGKPFFNKYWHPDSRKDPVIAAQWAKFIAESKILTDRWYELDFGIKVAKSKIKKKPQTDVRQLVMDTLSRVHQLTTDADWEESKHDRDEGGKFAKEAAPAQRRTIQQWSRALGRMISLTPEENRRRNAKIAKKPKAQSAVREQVPEAPRSRRPNATAGKALSSDPTQIDNICKRIFGRTLKAQEVRDMYKVDDIEGYEVGSLDLDGEEGSDELEISGSVPYSGTDTERQGGRTGRFARTFSKDSKGNLIVEHVLFTLDPKHQGKGVAMALNYNAEQAYRKLGVKYVKLQADIDVGRYAWAREGFDFEDNFKTGPMHGHVAHEKWIALQQFARAYHHVNAKQLIQANGGKVPEHAWEFAELNVPGITIKTETKNNDKDGNPVMLDCTIGKAFMLQDSNWNGRKILDPTTQCSQIGDKYMKTVMEKAKVKP